MGLTVDSLKRLDRHGVLSNTGTVYEPNKMLELGCQNIFAYPNEFHWVAKYGMLAKHFFQRFAPLQHISWDITGCQCSEKIDLRDNSLAEKYRKQFDVITDYGTTEHIENDVNIGGYYDAMKNIHEILKVGGLRIHEVPATGHWKGHGFNYVNEDFFRKMADDCGYVIIEMSHHYAMNNTVSGKLVCVVMRKVHNREFISRQEFASYPVFSE
jgi:hypothetical protein